MYDGIIVLGMHRSGTSLTGSLLEEMGISFGDELIEADEFNRAGYFENANIVQANARLLHALDRRWTGPKGTLLIDPGNLEPKLRVEIRDRIKNELASMNANTQKMWGIKDPRISRLIPFWMGILDEMDLHVMFVLCVRHPLEVAKSVGHRDGLSLARAQLLWLKHNRDALTNIKKDDLRVVVFDRWFNDLETQTGQIIDAFKLNDEIDRQQVIQALKSIIRPDLRHQQPHDLEFLPYIEELYELLVESSETGGLSAGLWALLDEVDKAESLFSDWSDIVRDQVEDDRLKLGAPKKKEGWLGNLLAGFAAK